MSWIKVLKTWYLDVVKPKPRNDQQQLMLFVCIVSYLMTSTALFYTNLSGYLIAFILILLALFFIYANVAGRLNAEYQIRTLANLIESMIDGDYSLRGRLHTNRAYEELLTLINDLAETLATHKIEAKESRLLLERIMEQMDAMVLATNDQGFVVMANASAKKLILGNVDQIDKIELNNTLIGAAIENAQAGILALKQEQLKGEHFLFKESFLSEGKRHQLYLLTNAERLLMEKERTAWQSLLRVLSHEMNNSLTPIAAISESMGKKLKKEYCSDNQQSLLEGVEIINERAESLSNFIASYSQLSYLPKPNKAMFSLIEVIEKISSLYPDLSIDFEQCSDELIEADRSQFEQVLINLFKNSIEAMANKSIRKIVISSEREGHWLNIKFNDFGGGIANLDNIFVPFYTTKNQGSGIGLALSRQILFNHNGLISIKNNDENNGAEVTLSLPRSC